MEPFEFRSPAFGSPRHPESLSVLWCLCWRLLLYSAKFRQVYSSSTYFLRTQSTYAELLLAAFPSSSAARRCVSLRAAAERWPTQRAVQMSATTCVFEARSQLCFNKLSLNFARLAVAQQETACALHGALCSGVAGSLAWAQWMGTSLSAARFNELVFPLKPLQSWGAE